MDIINKRRFVISPTKIRYIFLVHTPEFGDDKEYLIIIVDSAEISVTDERISDAVWAAKTRSPEDPIADLAEQFEWATFATVSAYASETTALANHGFLISVSKFNANCVDVVRGSKLYGEP